MQDGNGVNSAPKGGLRRVKCKWIDAAGLYGVIKKLLFFDHSHYPAQITL